MKAIIYAGIGLFSAASVYGVVDYYNDSHNGQLKNLYKEEEISDKPEMEIKENVAVLTNTTDANEKKEITAVQQKKKLKKNAGKKIDIDDFSRGKIMPPMIVEEEIVPEIKNVEIVMPQKEVLPNDAVADEKTTEVPDVKERRKINLENFSRAPLKYKKNKKVKE